MKRFREVSVTGKSLMPTRHGRRPKRQMEWDKDIAVAKANWGRCRSVQQFLNLCQPTLEEDFACLEITPDDDPIK